jgi:phosphoribosyl-ATP pyrophosphohydrolase/phosphoribosyl-AMP cyclohydrolase
MFISNGKAVKWFDDDTVISDEIIGLARAYSKHGADELIVFDLSKTEEEHDANIDLIKQIDRMVHIPMVVGGHIHTQEDIKKVLYTGAKRVILNFSKPEGVKLIEDGYKRFGKEKIAVSLDDFDALFKHLNIIKNYSTELIFMNNLDLNSVVNVTDVPCVIVSDAMEEKELFDILKADGVKGLSGKYISRIDMDFTSFKKRCGEEDIKIATFESMMDFSKFKTNEQGLIPVVVQHYMTQEVLMVAYMNEEAFNHTMKSGRMTYYSRSRQQLWIKGETSGHYQYVKSLTIDCDYDTILAKVDQIGAACHTGNPTCFFQPLAGNDQNEGNPLKVFETVYNSISEEKHHPKEGSYTNFLFEKGIDSILKKLAEGTTETVIASKNPKSDELKYSMSDLLYHMMILMVEKGVTWNDIMTDLADRI